MTDRELLERAAKAAGFGHPVDSADVGLTFKWGDGAWNPLTDDGDALRLAVKLGITIGPNYDGQGVTPEWRSALASRFMPYTMGVDCSELHGDDPYAATRRAIVRAAAEIGSAT
jgi:hypothetical protein